MKNFKDFLNNLDNHVEPISTYLEISDKIKNFLKGAEKISNELEKEQMIFDLVEDYNWKETQDDFFNWGTYYWPMFIFPSKEDEKMMNVYPHINKVDQNLIDYYLKRANESKNPVLVTRYISVSLDFSNKLWLRKVDFEFIKKYLYCILEIYQKALITDSYFLLQELKRAVFISKTYNQKEYFEKLKEIIIKYEEKQTNWNMWLWWDSFDIFVNENKGLQIGDAEKEQIMDKIIYRLEEEDKKELPNVYIIEKALLVLRKLKENSSDKFEKLYNLIISIYNKNIEANNNEFFKINYLKWLLDLYQEYGNIDEKEDTMRRINSIDLSKWLKKISSSFKITGDEVEDYIRWFFWENNSYDLGKILLLISKRFILTKNNAQKDLEKKQKEFVLYNLFSTLIIDKDGWLVWTISSDEEERKLIHEARQNIDIWNIFLEIVLNHFIESIKKEKFYNYLISKCDILEWENEIEIQELIDNIYSKKSYCLVWILIPLIEKLFRKIVHINWWNVKKKDEFNGGFMYKSLWEILNDKIITNLFTENIVFYFKVVLSERLWLNLRNDFCHWIDREKFYNYHIALRILHVFFTLITFTKINWEYKVNIFFDKEYISGANKNQYSYNKELKDDNSKKDFINRIWIQMFEKDKIVNSVIILSNSWSSGFSEKSAIIKWEKIYICVWNKVYCLNIPSLDLVWEKKCDFSSCFSIHEYKDDFIIHWELDITRINKKWEIIWQKWWDDIFVTDKWWEFEIKDNYIKVRSWSWKLFTFDWDWNEI